MSPKGIKGKEGELIWRDGRLPESGSEAERESSALSDPQVWLQCAGHSGLSAPFLPAAGLPVVSGKTLPSVDHLYALSRLLGVHMEELLAGPQENPVYREVFGEKRYLFSYLEQLRIGLFVQ